MAAPAARLLWRQLRRQLRRQLLPWLLLSWLLLQWLLTATSHAAAQASAAALAAQLLRRHPPLLPRLQRGQIPRKPARLLWRHSCSGGCSGNSSRCSCSRCGCSGACGRSGGTAAPTAAPTAAAVEVPTAAAAAWLLWRHGCFGTSPRGCSCRDCSPRLLPAAALVPAADPVARLR